MQSDFKSLANIKENIIINNASKDFTEFFINELYGAKKQKIVFINEGLSINRIIKNFQFLNSEIKLLCIEDEGEIYSLKSQPLNEIGERNRGINKLLKGDFDILVLNYNLLLKKLPNRQFFEEKIVLKIGEKFGHSNLVNKLFDFGFLRQDTVFDFAEFAVRGFIVDVGTLDGFFRVEFDGENVSSIVKFNTESQRKSLTESPHELEIFRIKDAVLKDGWMQLVRKNAFNIGFEEVQLAVNDIANFGGISLNAFLPLFYEETASILSFLPQGLTFVTYSSLPTTLDFYEKNLQETYNLYKKEGRGFLPKNLLLHDKKSILLDLKPRIELECYF
jgi:transcription-repair coupling factor (superfamily II helicase)